MKGLFRVLPPLSPDTSGFCAVMMRTDGAGVLDDPQGCATNYIGSEEPEATLPVRVFASHLSDLDAIFGSQDRLLARFEEIWEETQPRFVLFGGSPVTALIGTDLKAAAQDCSAQFGIPCAGVELNGHETYETGMAKTLSALGALFAGEREAPIPGSVNLLGLNVLDHGADAVRNLPRQIEERGLRVLSVYGGAATAEQLSLAHRAERNLVVSVSGLPLARWMETRYGIPYSLFCGDPPVKPLDGFPKRVMILGEQLLSHRLRGLMEQMGAEEVRAAGLFTMDDAYLRPGDCRVTSEDEIRALAEKGQFDLWVCDPLFAPLLPPGTRLLPLPHPAVSGPRFADRMPPLEGGAPAEWLAETWNKTNGREMT